MTDTFGTAAVQAEEALTAYELDRARLYLDQTRSGIIGAIKNLSDSQWTFNPGSGRWSIAQIVDHIVIVQDLVLGPVRDQLEQTPVSPAHADAKLVDDIVIFQIPNRLLKFPSPEQPAGNLSPCDALDRLSTNYVRFKQRLGSTRDLRYHSIASVPMKAISNGAYDSMDGYQWILAAAAHTERHTKQILEVIAEENFPGR